ncbi:MAG: ATP-binding protein [Vicinamibacterales bacterium]
MASRGLTLGPSVVAAGTAVTLLLLFVSGRQNVSEMQILRDESARIQHTLDVQRDLDAVRISVSEADAAVRSFLLTNDPDALAGYRSARENVTSRLDRIASVTSDGAGQRERAAKLQAAVAARMDRLGVMVEARHAGSLDRAIEEARAVPVTGPGDELRTLIADMEVAEGQPLAERRDEAGRAYQRAVTGRIISTIGSTALLLAIAGIAGFHARTKAKREVELVESERRAREAAVREQEARTEAEGANRQKDQFLAVLSHELRTPLNAVLGWTQILQTAGPSESTIVRALASIRRNAETQQRLVEDLLDVSRIISGKLPFEKEPFNLRVAVSAAVESIRPAVGAKGLTLDSDLENTRPVMGDPGRIQQVAGNLLSNAVKFTQSGGHLSVRLLDREDSAFLEVSDDGVGLSPELLPHIFERFRQGDGSMTRAHGGLGLGLAIAKHIVDAHGGSITVESPGLNHGATFRVRLPYG